MKLSDRIAKYYNLEVETRVVKGIENNILEIYKILQLYNIIKHKILQLIQRQKFKIYFSILSFRLFIILLN